MSVILASSLVRLGLPTCGLKSLNPLRGLWLAASLACSTPCPAMPECGIWEDLWDMGSRSLMH